MREHICATAQWRSRDGFAESLFEATHSAMAVAFGRIAALHWQAAKGRAFYDETGHATCMGRDQHGLHRPQGCRRRDSILSLLRCSDGIAQSHPPLGPLGQRSRWGTRLATSSCRKSQSGLRNAEREGGAKGQSHKHRENLSLLLKKHGETVRGSYFRLLTRNDRYASFRGCPFKQVTWGTALNTSRCASGDIFPTA